MADTSDMTIDTAAWLIALHVHNRPPHPWAIGELATRLVTERPRARA